MLLHTIVKNPERATSLEEIDSLLKKVEACEKETDQRCVILVTQSRGRAGFCSIESKDEAVSSIKNKGKYEWGVKYYDKDHLLKLKENYSR
jgi:hypothetical protein